MCERRGRLYTWGWEDAKNGDGLANEKTALAGFFSRDSGAFLAGFGEPDRDGLLAAFYAASLAAFPGPQGATLPSAHGARDGFGRSFAVSAARR